MTAKEKAQLIIDKFYQRSPSEYGTGKALGYAVECAIILVDEIEDLDTGDSIDKYYWREVKNELIKL